VTIVGTFTSNLRNVTAIATGPNSLGIDVFAVNPGANETLVAKNVIADGVGTDIAAEAADGTSAAVATMSTSDYDSRTQTPGAGTATVTAPGTGTNLTAAPLFTDAGAGLFHQAVGSPTIDTGAVTDLLGTLDIDGDARALGSYPDIGADEYIPAPLYPLPATSPPATFDVTAAIKRCKKKFRKGTRARKRCIKKARTRAGY
jgi:hypothetical protein